MPAPCPACGTATLTWCSAPAAELAVPDVELSRCPACGTAVTLGPLPADIDLHETGDYATATPRGARLAAPLLWLFDRQRLRLARWAVRPPARLVDAGAG
ncbi:MAG: class SAM-dependent methyltransferase, partial [Solirubrobacterales bacterium]|nr:class SAM-dependent methyltransferase [Solirubrobacterales bacterium]